jgi:hypothetical protein
MKAWLGNVVDCVAFLRFFTCPLTLAPAPSLKGEGERQDIDFSSRVRE